MLDRRQELEEFKKINLSVVLASFNWEIDRKRSTKASVTMVRGADKVIVTEQRGHFVFCSVFDDAKGSIIDYIQQIERPGASLGEVRQICRPFLNSGYVSTLQRQHAGRFAGEIKSVEVDHADLRQRFDKLPLITGHHDF